jgi:hypothetical protein
MSCERGGMHGVEVRGMHGVCELKEGLLED